MTRPQDVSPLRAAARAAGFATLIALLLYAAAAGAIMLLLTQTLTQAVDDQLADRYRLLAPRLIRAGSPVPPDFQGQPGGSLGPVYQWLIQEDSVLSTTNEPNLPAQYQQAVVGPAQQRDQQVQVKQLPQALRVLLAAFGLVQLGGQLADPPLQPSRQRHEHRPDIDPQQRLLRCGTHRLPMHRVERPRHLGDLVPPGHMHRRGPPRELRRRQRPQILRLLQRGHRRRQARVGHRVCGIAQPTQPPQPSQT